MKEFTIVGGGIAGASIAYHLAKKGQHVTVYDRFDQGQATFASAGIICPWTSQRRNKKWYRLVQEGARYYPAFIKDLEQTTNQPTGYKQNGAICLFKDDRIQQLAYERISAKQEASPEMGSVTKMAKKDVKALHPYLTDYYPAVFVEGGGQIDGESLLTSLKKGVLAHGGNWLVEDVDPRECQGTVIYTAGAWAGEFHDQPTIRHQRAELLHFQLDEDADAMGTPVVMGLGPMYIVGTGAGNSFAIGTTHEKTEEFSVAPSAENKAYLHHEAERYFPDVNIDDHKVSVGLRPFTRDSLPFIGYNDDNIFVVNGLGSTGLTAGPVIGREVAAFLSGEETTLNLADYGYYE
ncbi:FAD-binding oxidoreductase [Gracilibacillus caseinilyticus]|uniref:FAD-binding oxidoreductase n=1 Tax=Gracilibacillus caseinilyticus TaxID=2932256 RepID=A0ABY4F020_9BACI|nr:FAD-dependent oxidoreductase [Gracilibacillus caseinilyticus]UOQ49860.1 FAD-binding oxidoreductase [Gracilibacillus caseinilyticus]